MDSPFVGPTYPLKSKTSSVARTVNMHLLQIETGNERAQYVFQDTPGLVEFETYVIPPTPPTPLVNCELLVHFDDTDPSLWKDYSIRDRGLVTRVGTVTYTAEGKYSGGALFDGASYATVDGLDNFGLSEFYMSCWTSADPTLLTAGHSYGLMTNWGTSTEDGWLMYLGPNQVFGGFAASGQRALGTVGTVNAKNLVSLSRKNGVNGVEPKDRLSVFWNGVRVGYLDILSTHGPLTSTRTNCVIGALSDNSGIHGQVLGMIDEAYIIKGAGTGIDTDFTPPAGPYILP